MESIFVTENSIDAGRFVNECIEVTKQKIGEIFHINDDDFLMCCIHCGQEFHHFHKFTMHIQQHYRRGEIAELPKEIDNNDDDDVNDYEDAPESPIEDVESTTNDNKFQPMSTKHFESSEDKKPQNDAEHIILEPQIEINTSTEPVRFIEGTDYEQPIKHVYRCLICSHQTTAGWHHFKDHLLTHSHVPNILCPICSKAFAAVSYVRKHVNRTHKMKITADKIREAQSTLKGMPPPVDSPSTAQQNRPIDKTMQSFREGKDYERTNGRFKCLACGRVMLDHIREHLLTHKTAKNVHCPLCDKPFIAVSYVRKHVNRAHKMKITADEIKIAQTTIDLSEENDTHKDMKSINLQRTNDDDDDVHSKPSIETTITAIAQQKYFECFECHRSFTSLGSLRIHMKLHSDIRYQCMYCDRLFAMRKYVSDHIVLMHGIRKRDEISKDCIRETTIENVPKIRPNQQSNDNAPPFQCSRCQRTYNTKQTLRQHMKLHTNGPFLCVICGSVYKSMANLRYHMERHQCQADPNKRHKCLFTSCPKTFPVRQNMLNHYRKIHLRKGEQQKIGIE